jgi:hypothetical protein
MASGWQLICQGTVLSSAWAAINLQSLAIPAIVAAEKLPSG